MKIIFEFNMPEDQEEYKIFSQTGKIHSVLYELKNELRDTHKYGIPNERDHHWKNRLQALLDEHDVKL